MKQKILPKYCIIFSLSFSFVLLQNGKVGHEIETIQTLKLKKSKIL